MNVKTFDSLCQEFREYLIANQDKLTDFTDGSIINTFIEAHSMQMENFYIDTRNGFINNLKNIIYSLFNFSQKNGSYASGHVVFSRSKAITTQTDIPSGTKVSDGIHLYKTQARSYILAEEINSPSVPIIAIEAGEDYNIPAGAITSIESIVPVDIVSVTNALEIKGGSNVETESEMFNRFSLYINSLQGTSIYAVESGILNDVNLPTIRKVKVVEHFEEDRETNFTLYAYNGSNTLTSSEEYEIKQILDGNGTATRPGIRPIGVSYDIKSVQRNSVDIEYKVTVSDTTQNVKNDIKTEIENLFASLDIGDTLYISELIATIRKLSYIEDVSIVTPSSNVAISNNSINVLGTLTMNED